MACPGDRIMNPATAVSAPETVIDITARLSRAAQRSNEPACFCATTLQQVEAAWSLVYRRYSQMGLIEENPYGIHAVPTAIGTHACVLWGPEDANVGYTMTLFRDNPQGLALDSVYALALNDLRRKGRRLMEVGMLADRRESAARGMAALFAMMRRAIYYGLQTDLTDIVIGVHPRHAQFYVRCYGFEQFAEETIYPMVRDNPVVPLRLRLREALAKEILPRGLADARDKPVCVSEFAQHFSFDPQQLRGSLLSSFMQDRHGIDPSRVTHPGRTSYSLALTA